jgi:excisionase family DNA binding protein
MDKQAQQLKALTMKNNLRPDEVAAIIGVSRRTVYWLIEEGELSAFRFRKRGLRIKSESLERDTFGREDQCHFQYLDTVVNN